MGHKDIISKTLIKQIAVDFGNILFKLNITADHLTLLETEQQRIEERRADFIARVKDPNSSDSYILHIEIQNNNHPQMPLRMLRYYTDIALNWKNEPIRQYLIYIGKKPLRMKARIDEDEADWHYQYPMFDMRDLDYQQLLEKDTPDALVLAILCDFKGHPAQEIINTILIRLKQLLIDDDKGFRSYLNRLEVLSENRDLKESIKEAEQMLNDIDVTRLPSYELGMEKGEAIGEVRGDQKRQLLIAKNMLGKLSDKDILEFTGLSIKTLNKLKEHQPLDS